MTTQSAAGSGPCADIKVLEFATMVSGPMCGQILGDLGADVIKLESATGDVMRTMPPHYRGLSGYFAQYNRNKRSIVLDLKSSAGRVQARRLAERVDVIIENFRPGVTRRLGLDYDSLRPANAGLIYLSINGFGETGPYAGQPAYDHVIQGLVGFMPVQGEDGPPLPVKGPVVDKVAAMSGALAILAALNQRHVTGGRGQQINVRMLDAWAAFILHERVHNFTFQSEDAPRSPVRNTFRAFATRDGHVIGLVFQDDQFRGICAALQREDLLTDPRFATPAARVFNIDDLHRAVAADIAALSTAEFLAAMRCNNVPFAPVNDLDGFFADPQVRHNSSYVDVEDAEFGPMRNLAFMARFDAAPSGFRHRPPKLGEHTEEVMREFALSSPTEP